LTEGSLEEKVHARCVNKVGLANRLIDEKAFKRLFSSSEIEDLQQLDNWAACDLCDKWRKVSKVPEDNEEVSIDMAFRITVF
jgi:hypothetical protein